LTLTVRLLKADISIAQPDVEAVVAHWCFDNPYMQEPLLREAF
jgi:hypothetical protein